MTAVVSVSRRGFLVTTTKAVVDHSPGRLGSGRQDCFSRAGLPLESPSAESQTTSERNAAGMITKKHMALATLASCAVVLSLLGGTKPERPVKMKAEITIVVSLADGKFVSPNSGQSTEIGRFTNIGVGFMDLNSLAISFAKGTVVAANGEELFWRQTAPSWYEFVGGTGKFANATGGFNFVLTVKDVTMDYETMTMSIEGTYTGEGTISY
jgi:hypothetical protein